MRLLSLTLTAVITLATTSCGLLKPKDQTAAYDPYGAQANPYGQTANANPYGAVPNSNPYGTAPAANTNANPYGSYEAPQSYTPPSSTYSAPSSYSGGGGGGGGGSVTVKSGDTLTAIARRNNTSVSALKSANGLSGDLIRVGQTLRLP